MPDIDDIVGGFDVSALQAGLGLAATTINSDRAARLFAGLSTAVAVVEFAHKGQQWLKRKKTYTIKINENDKLFEIVQKWLITSIPSKDQRSIVIASKRAPSGMNPYAEDEVLPDDELLNIFFDGEKRQSVKFNNDSVVIAMSSEHVAEKQGANNMKTSSLRTVTIICRSMQTRDALISMLTDKARVNYNRKPTFWVARKWGGFRSESDIPVRPQDTVILREGQRERIIGEIQEFLSNESRYVELGLPWHMGVLFKGPPGTGKTSLATTIAHTLNIDIHYISLSSIESDEALLELLGDVSPRSVLLLEDIDVAHASNSRDDSKPGVTLSGLLNGLDGIATPHGVITIMTTNHFDVLDPALIRPGRVDILEEIGYVTNEQVHRLCIRFIGFVPDGLPDIMESDEIVPSEIIEVFKNNLKNKEEAGRMLVKKFAGIVKERDNVKVVKKTAPKKPAAKKSKPAAKAKA